MAIDLWDIPIEAFKDSRKMYPSKKNVFIAEKPFNITNRRPLSFSVSQCTVPTAWVFLCNHLLSKASFIKVPLYYCPERPRVRDLTRADLNQPADLVRCPRLSQFITTNTEFFFSFDYVIAERQQRSASNGGPMKGLDSLASKTRVIELWKSSKWKPALRKNRTCQNRGRERKDFVNENMNLPSQEAGDRWECTRALNLL
jgi:hypothetical protein